MKNIHLTSVLTARARSQPGMSLGFPWASSLWAGELPFCAMVLAVLALALFA